MKSRPGPSETAVSGEHKFKQLLSQLTYLIHAPFRRVDRVDIALLLDSHGTEAGVVQRGAAVDDLAGRVHPISRVDLAGWVVACDIQPIRRSVSKSEGKHNTTYRIPETSLHRETPGVVVSLWS